jgi:hypothetical protein
MSELRTASSSMKAETASVAVSGENNKLRIEHRNLHGALALARTGLQSADNRLKL